MQARAAAERREPGRPRDHFVLTATSVSLMLNGIASRLRPNGAGPRPPRAAGGRFPGRPGGAFPVAGGSYCGHGAGTGEEVRAAGVVVLPFVPASVGVARGQFRAELRSAGITAAPAADAALVMSELLSNAILHARPLPDSLVRVAWELSPPRLEVMVSDGGSTTRPQAARPSLSAIGGRGLSIMRNRPRKR